MESNKLTDPLLHPPNYSSLNDFCYDITGLQDLARQGSWRTILEKITQARKLSLLQKPHEHLTYLAYNALALAKLRRYGEAAEELDTLGDFEDPKYRYESHGYFYEGMFGSMIPFFLRWLHAEMPNRLGRRQETLDRLYGLLEFVENKIALKKSVKKTETHLVKSSETPSLGSGSETLEKSSEALEKSPETRETLEKGTETLEALVKSPETMEAFGKGPETLENVQKGNSASVPFPFTYSSAEEEGAVVVDPVGINESGTSGGLDFVPGSPIRHVVVVSGGLDFGPGSPIRHVGVVSRGLDFSSSTSIQQHLGDGEGVAAFESLKLDEPSHVEFGATNPTDAALPFGQGMDTDCHDRRLNNLEEDFGEFVSSKDSAGSKSGGQFEVSNLGTSLVWWLRREELVINSILRHHLSQKDYMTSIKWLERLLERKPSDPFLLSRVGYLQLQLGDLSGAKTTFLRIEAMVNKGQASCSSSSEVLKNMINHNRALQHLVENSDLDFIKTGKEGSMKTDNFGGEIDDQSPIEQVALTVSTTDNPSLPVLTFRMWVLGIASCVVLAFLNQFFFYRENPLTVTTITAQIAVLPLGQFMAATLPTKKIRFPGTKWQFTLNPGPFNVKEHVLITILASAGSGGVYAVHIVTIMKSQFFYNIKMHPLAGWLLAATTQMLGFGWAGLFRKFLVESAYMWWPTNLVQVSVFRTLHEKDKRSKGGMTRLQFFLVTLTCSFAYYILPNYLFGTLSSVSIACYIWKDKVLAHQLGSGYRGLGIGSFSFDWTVIASTYLGSPLATPWFAIANIMAGFFIILYVITPLTYWTNVYDANKFPIISSGTYDINGTTYDKRRVLKDSTFDRYGYDHYSKLHLSTFFAITYGVGFAGLAATLSHVLLFHGKKIWRQTKASLTDENVDVHTRLMKKNYSAVPQYWFVITLVVFVALAIFTCEGFGGQLQLPWWGVLLACALAFSFTLPVGILQATTNVQPGLNIITEYIIGYLYQGKPFANVAFKTYGYISMGQALTFLQDFKLGHYMKIPPRSMFLVQLVGTAVAASVYFGTAWWMLGSVENLCDKSIIGNLWTCPLDRVFYSASIIWGVIGPERVFGDLGLYKNCNWFFLGGALAPIPVWLLSRQFPKVKWIQLINMPILIGATGVMPPATAINYLSWGTAGFIFNFIIFRRHKKWWSRHNYILSGALDAGVAFLGVLCYFVLQFKGHQNLDWWGGTLGDDHCLLANCPTAPGVLADYNPDCPLFH